MLTLDVNSNYNENKELIEYLTPVINVAIHDALVLRAIVDYRDNLERKVSERTFELQKARDELSDTNELLKEAQQAQSHFFTNISHEFRTPLTLILGPSKQLSNESNDEKTKTQAELIHRSASKLNRLVDELLDISKIEAGEMKLKACPVNVVTVVSELAFSFIHLLRGRKLNSISVVMKMKLSSTLIKIKQTRSLQMFYQMLLSSHLRAAK